MSYAAIWKTKSRWRYHRSFKNIKLRRVYRLHWMVVRYRDLMDCEVTLNHEVPICELLNDGIPMRAVVEVKQRMFGFGSGINNVQPPTCEACRIAVDEMHVIEER